MNFSRKRQRVYNHAREVAQLYYEKRGYVPATLNLILNMTESDEAFLKYNPDQPRVPAGNPDGGQWTNGEGGSNGGTAAGDNGTGSAHEAVDKPRGFGPGRFGLPPRPPRAVPASKKYPTSQVQSLDDAKRIVTEANGHFLGRNSACASLVHKLAPELPPTPEWKPGDLVQNNTNIPVGTPIATFNFRGEYGTNGYGPRYSLIGERGSSHTGVYLGQSDDGVSILHQYSGQPPEIRTIPWDRWNGRRLEAGSRYYTIDY